MSITPTVYQVDAVQKAREALRETSRALIVMATALGKTITSALVWHGFVEGRGLFLVHNNTILKGASKGYIKVYGKRLKYAFLNGDSKDIQGAEIVFATFQTMGNFLDVIPSNYFAWMTVDESHHSQAESYKVVINHFDCPKLGITATPDRLDLLDIREIFGEEVIDISLEEAIAKGWLPRVEYHLVADQGLDEEALQQIMREVLEEGKRLTIEEINRRVFIRARDEKVAEIIEGYSEKAIIFCRNIQHAEHFAPFLTEAEVYHSRLPSRRTDKILENLEVGKTRRVLTVNAFNEGVDVPDVGLVAFYRSTDSRTIFFQQLGRGMRRADGKEKLIALDFVGNIERIKMIKEIVDRIHDFAERETGGGYGVGAAFHVTGANYDFTFSDTIVDLLKVVERVESWFYSTWQEASVAAQELGLKTSMQYKEECTKDPKLPTNPNAFYPDFPDWFEFLGKERRKLYETWQEASSSAQKLGIKSQTEYYERYREDPLLHSGPHRIYSNFPGYREFLGLGFYPTWQEASMAAQKLKISNKRDYEKRYKLDPRLTVNVRTRYSDFPGWAVFLGKTK